MLEVPGTYVASALLRIVRACAHGDGNRRGYAVSRIQSAAFRVEPYAQEGLYSILLARPVLYASVDAHHSFLKAARIAGLGSESVRTVPVDGSLRMDVIELVRFIRQDREAGRTPLIVVATAGATGTGAIDPIVEIAGVAQREQLWLHVDAAWGGFAAFLPELPHR